MTEQEWDRLWGVFYDRELAKGKTPNEAIPVAYREMFERFGPRPEDAA